MDPMATDHANSVSPVIPKTESIQDGLTPSSDSSSTAEPEASNSTGTAPTDPPPVPKRKGGRKPIYATSEERKQRNRQAQAAFRERRTEYIKQLETTIQHQEDTIHNLQQSHRTAADECLMLRYKNSLLERVLLEKGIDVQAELRHKASPNLRPIRHGASMTGQPSPMQRAIMNRQQHARQRPTLTSPIQTQTPTSQQSSPSTLRSPGFPMNASMASPTGELPGAQPQRSMNQLEQNPYPTQARPHTRDPSANFGVQQFNHGSRQQQVGSMQSSLYQTSFQKHYDQLGKSSPEIPRAYQPLEICLFMANFVGVDQEYDAQTDLLDEVDNEDVDTDTFIPNFRLPPVGGNVPAGLQISPITTNTTNDTGGGNQSVPFDYDPMLDADPFGLTASMHIPNTFNYSSIRRQGV